MASKSKNPPMRSDFVLGLGPHGFHEIRYTEWGDPHNPQVMVCVHGLTRNCRDFDFIAEVLAQDFRVICPDMPGRGRSDWLTEKSDYNYSVYLADIAVLLGRLNVQAVDWLGTSMGGLIGMLLAAQPKTPIRRLLLNDIGPYVHEGALQRISEYVGRDPRFEDMQAVEKYLRIIHQPFGPLTDPQWAHLSAHSVRSLADGGFALHYDPGIAEPFKANGAAPIDLWGVWDTILCPVRALRGIESDLLTKDVADEMTLRGPKAELVEFSGIGHAPALMSDDQIRAVQKWFAPI